MFLQVMHSTKRVPVIGWLWFRVLIFWLFVIYIVAIRDNVPVKFGFSGFMALAGVFLLGIACAVLLMMTGYLAKDIKVDKKKCIICISMEQEWLFLVIPFMFYVLRLDAAFGYLLSSVLKLTSVNMAAFVVMAFMFAWTFSVAFYYEYLFRKMSHQDL